MWLESQVDLSYGVRILRRHVFHWRRDGPIHLPRCEPAQISNLANKEAQPTSNSTESEDPGCCEKRTAGRRMRDDSEVKRGKKKGKKKKNPSIKSTYIQLNKKHLAGCFCVQPSLPQSDRLRRVTGARWEESHWPRWQRGSRNSPRSWEGWDRVSRFGSATHPGALCSPGLPYRQSTLGHRRHRGS